MELQHPLGGYTKVVQEKDLTSNCSEFPPSLISPFITELFVEGPPNPFFSLCDMLAGGTHCPTHPGPGDDGLFSKH